MIDSKLLEILVCPESKEPVRVASEEELKKINTAISDQKCENKAGTKLLEALEGALITQNNSTAYPIKSDIPVMLIDEGISVKDILS